MTNIGARIRQLRKQINLTQQAFADKAGVQRAYLADVERGVREPSFNMLRAIFETYKVSSDWLLTGEGSMYRQAETPKPDQKAVPIPPAPPMPPSDLAMYQMYLKLPKEEQERIKGVIQEREQIAEMRERLDKLEQERQERCA